MYSYTTIFIARLEICLSNVVQIISQIYHMASILQYLFFRVQIFFEKFLVSKYHNSIPFDSTYHK